MILHWHNPANGRRYQAVLDQDLFGDSFLWRGWCGADGRRGGERKDVFTWEEEGLRALRRVIRRRERRGYVLDLLPCAERGRVGGGCLRGPRCVQSKPSAAQKTPETNAGVVWAAKPLVQVPAGDALGERT